MMAALFRIFRFISARSPVVSGLLIIVVVVDAFDGVFDSAFLGAANAQRAPSGEGRGLGPKSVAPVAEGLVDAVVNISTTQVDRGPQGVPLPNVPEGSPFEEFFEDFFDRRGKGANPQRKISSLGSGFVIDGKTGIVVTNHHVIADADEIVVNFNDGSKLKVEKVLGVDAKTDLAVLKVNPEKPLVDVSFGRSNVLRVGDWVMAIGNPFGLGGSVTVGIISAKQRDIKSGPYDSYLQTDAAINKGNSGGPLFNMAGEVVGINTAIISPSGGSIGIGFAVPSDAAERVITQLTKFGEVRRGWLGVKVQTVSEEIASSLGVAANTGALVSAVEPSSPADKSGLQAGDVILSFNNESVSMMRSLPRVVARTDVGARVDVEVLRGGVRKHFKVTVGLLREKVLLGKVSGNATGSDNPGGATNQVEVKRILGMMLAPLDDALAQKYGLSGDMKGVVVVEIDPLSDAGKRKIDVGDVIVEVGQEPVSEPRDVIANIGKVRASGRGAVLLRVEDKAGELKFVAVPIR